MGGVSLNHRSMSWQKQLKTLFANSQTWETRTAVTEIHTVNPVWLFSLPSRYNMVFERRDNGSCYITLELSSQNS